MSNSIKGHKNSTQFNFYSNKVMITMIHVTSSDIVVEEKKYPENESKEQIKTIKLKDIK